ncbi:glycosyltransferase family 4 protein, partial [Candidatus Woesearchaeota archaeon]|nr:glycosyltransferase family 4 protein [Candidatus Woesearchaeota archaeon]
IIHTTTYNGAFPAKIASILARKPCIITIHEILGNNWKNFGMSSLKSFLHKYLEKAIIKLNFHRYISVSNSTQNQVLAQGILRNKSIVIYNGIDYDFWNPKRYSGKIIRKEFNLEKDFVYLFYGRPGISKGLEYLIKAVPLISKKIKNAKLFAIVSRDKAYKKRYKRILNLIKKMGIKDKIILYPYIPVPYKQLPKFIKMADCVVVPSLSEGFGFTAAESCAMNKPVVASNTTSLPEVVSGKFILIKPKNPESIAVGVIKIHNKKIPKTKLKRFEIKKNIEKHLNCYNKLLA